MKRSETATRTIILCVLGIAFLGTGFFLVGQGKDFLALYAGARLVGTGHMYDPQAIWKVQVDQTGIYGPSLLFTRIPCFALFLWPVAQLPYGAAKLVWTAIQLAAVIAAVWLWPGSRKWAMTVTCWSWPVLMCLADGADTALLLLWLVLWRRLEKVNRPVLAGMALALCIAKFHLFLLVPLLLLRHRRWSVMQGAALAISVLLALSFVAAGWRWPFDYVHVLRLPGINPGRVLMPNIHGLVPPVLELPATVMAVTLTCVAIFKLDYTAGTIAALFGSFLCSYHAYVMDGVMLLPAIFLAVERYRAQWPSYVAGILATPVPWVAVLLRGASRGLRP